ncbi:DUF3325 domain-containing protein [Alkalimonas mucilaginosa]|uniref:DUF3325 domain-containing protein n=1 Tax=Alkalimonas mucilaginosa TaxID=3057676 RepID=A0ABU7JGP7_9GAMM|nr:DUF3325 domain-containing protein [Alkalimonas sp. MEB004]MEE2024849.1 DUF3325 domain-containing protein [Alkalimonas sp. MEB004]
MMFNTLVFALILWSFVLLAQAMARHGKQIWGKALSASAEKRSRQAGAGLLLLSFTLLFFWLDFATALLLWLGYCTVAALIIALLLSYQPAWLRWKRM